MTVTQCISVESPKSQYQAGNFADAIRVIKTNLVREYRVAFTANQQAARTTRRPINNQNNQGTNAKSPLSEVEVNYRTLTVYFP